MVKVDEKDALNVAKAIRRLDELRNDLKFAFFEPYGWQKKFFHAGIENKQRMLMAANRVGKTKSSCVELAYHLTGYYPEWWDGIVFDHPINAWALGVSGEQIRDVLQTELFGDLNSSGFIGGLIPQSLITEFVRSITPKLAKDVSIRHRSGGVSTVSFKSYSQGQHVLMGSNIDYALIDEEPEDKEIYPQVLIRTATGNNGNGGYVVLSLTPENGITHIVNQFLNDRKDGQYLLNVTWDDAPHLTDAVKMQMLAAIPEYQRDMRSKGLPLMGSGLVFPISEEAVKVEPFKIPTYWPRIKGLDFGYDHPTALSCCVWDRDNDIFYVYDCYTAKGDNATPSYFAPAVNRRESWIPVAWPHDGLQHDKGSGIQLAQQYKDAGINMIYERATFEDGSNGLEAGVMDMLDRMKTGRLKVFSTCTDWFEEFRLYHRKDGIIVKIRDDLLAATRYALMMKRMAETEPNNDEYEESRSTHNLPSTGY